MRTKTALLRVALASVALSVVALPLRAEAQSTVDGASANLDAAAAFRAGVQALQDNRFADAARIFESLRRTQSTAATLFNLAMAYRGLGRVRDAVECLDQYLALPVDGGGVPLENVRQERARLRASLVAFALTVEQPTAGVHVAIDGRAQTEGQRAFELDPIAHVVEVSAAGYAPVRVELDGAPGQQISRTISLRPLGPRLVVEADAPRSRVRVDGVDRGSAPLELELEPGRHAIIVEAPGYEPSQRELSLGPSGVVRLSLSLSRRSLDGRSTARPSNARGWVVPVVVTASALAVAAVATGITVWAVTMEPPILGAYSLGVLREPVR
ncbi:MAG: PEGA domain-containing protein [Myxococcales bacterium]|nr:PEGA domain-containing protein [Myxococcales bacterium]